MAEKPWTSIDPVAVILVSSGSRGDKLLFRYPVDDDRDDDSEGAQRPEASTNPGPAGSTLSAPPPPADSKRAPPTSRQRPTVVLNQNPYAVPIVEDYGASIRPLKVPKTCVGPRGTLVGFSDKILATLLAVKQELCGGKFELKINDVVFVGHPKLLEHAGAGPPAQPSTSAASMETQPANKKEASTLILFNVVFALAAEASFEIRNCIHQLALSFAAALAHEEHRCGFLTHQAKRMIAVLDESAGTSASSSGSGAGAGSTPGGVNETDSPSRASPFKSMLSQCLLARNLADALDSLKENGVVQLHVNRWIPISFCLPHKVHLQRASRSYGRNSLLPKQLVRPFRLTSVLKALSSLQPYHGLLLLEESRAILERLPVDCSPALVRVIKTVSPLKKLETIAVDSDLALAQVFQIASHLVYWGKASVVYPLCENNVYVVSPKIHRDAVHDGSKLCRDFDKNFNRSLQVTLAEFSLPVPLGDHQAPYARPQEYNDRVKLLMWLLQRNLLQQLHTYVYLLVEDLADPPTPKSRGVFSKETTTTTTASAAFGSVDATSRSEEIPTTDSTPASWRASASSKTQELLTAELSSAERRAVFRLDAANNSDDLKLFARLVKYFRGRQHLEEIMFYENISRSQILIIVDKFREVLVATMHPDPVTSVFLE